MNIRSPQDGIITTWEARKNLMGRPVEIGTELLQIAATDGDWILEVEVPDDDMGPVLAAQAKLEEDIKAGRKKAGTTLRAFFLAMTDPEHRYEGYVIRIAPSAETMAESEQYKNRHIVKVLVGFSEAVRKDYMARNSIKEMHPGAEVRARVDCGRTNLAYYLLRKPIQVFYESVLFRWPFLHQAVCILSGRQTYARLGRSLAFPGSRKAGLAVQGVVARRAGHGPAITMQARRFVLTMIIPKTIAVLGAGCLLCVTCVTALAQNGGEAQQPANAARKHWYLPSWRESTGSTSRTSPPCVRA